LPDLDQLRRYAREIFDYALASVDPRKAVLRAIVNGGSYVDVCGERIDVSSRQLYAIAIGKAASSMALGVDDAIGGRLSAGVITAPKFSEALRPVWKFFKGGHPLPNEASLAAAQAAFALLDRANDERAVVIFLVSGGGSAMIEWPIGDEISLDDLRRTNELLVGCGARINEINAVRRAFSAVKGGGLALRAPGAQLITLIVSDTNPGDEASVASGPTLPPPADAPDPLDVIHHYRLEHELPKSVLKSFKSMIPFVASYHVLLDNSTALEAAHQKAGPASVIARHICEQPIDEGCDLLLRETADCVISGGEFSCPVRGDGRGGRNLETVLRLALRMEGIVALSAGTDGIDGNSPAAGAIADPTTIARARNRGLDADDFLTRSDSYNFFEKLNDLIVTGPTGTNVRDLRILLKTHS
jgi:hydroxypyruvate reductase